MRFLIVSIAVLLSATFAFAASTPKEVCEQLAKAARNNDFDTFTKLSTPPGRGIASTPKANQKNFQSMHQKQLDRIKDLACGTELVAGNQAVVKATSKGESRLVPFHKYSDLWRFDLPTYQAFNQIQHGHHGKGGHKKK
ncbi:MAG: hypothetical protein H6617_10310 [Bdellovibrionaceae bacterium]|nr:hypothetical protein [Pseudobdellovibrionaceae bacterium]